MDLEEKVKILFSQVKKTSSGMQVPQSVAQANANIITSELTPGSDARPMKPFQGSGLQTDRAHNNRTALVRSSLPERSRPGMQAKPLVRISKIDLRQSFEVINYASQNAATLQPKHRVKSLSPDEDQFKARGDQASQGGGKYHNGFLPAAVRKQIHQSNNERGPRFKPDGGPNFFCFISPKAAVHKSTAVQGNEPISLRDNSVSVQTCPEHDSNSQNGDGKTITGTNKSQHTVIQIKMGENPARQSLTKLVEVFCGEQLGRNTVQSPSSTQRGEKKSKEKRRGSSKTGMQHPPGKMTSVCEPETVTINQHELIVDDLFGPHNFVNIVTETSIGRNILPKTKLKQ